MAVGVLKTEGVTSYVVAAGCAAAFVTGETRKQGVRKVCSSTEG